MDDTRRSRGYLPISMHMSHNIMSSTLLLYSGQFELVVLDPDVVPHLFDCGGCDSFQAQFAFGFREPDPEFSPCAEAITG